MLKAGWDYTFWLVSLGRKLGGGYTKLPPFHFLPVQASALVEGRAADRDGILEFGCMLAHVPVIP